MIRRAPGFIELQRPDGQSISFAIAHIIGFGALNCTDAKAWIEVGSSQDNVWNVKETVDEIVLAIINAQQSSQKEGVVA